MSNISVEDVADLLEQNEFSINDLEFLDDEDIKEISPNIKMKVALKKLRKRIQNGETIEVVMRTPVQRNQPSEPTISTNSEIEEEEDEPQKNVKFEEKEEGHVKEGEQEQTLTTSLMFPNEKIFSFREIDSMETVVDSYQRLMGEFQVKKVSIFENNSGSSYVAEENDSKTFKQMKIPTSRLFYVVKFEDGYGSNQQREESEVNVEGKMIEELRREGRLESIRQRFEEGNLDFLWRAEKSKHQNESYTELEARRQKIADRLRTQDNMGTVLRPNVRCHCYNGDGTLCAIVPNGTNLLIYETFKESDFRKWKLKWTLGNDYSKQILCVDWAPRTNKIVVGDEFGVCLVWKFGEEGEWVAELCETRNGCSDAGKGKLKCRFSPEEDKIAISGTSKLIEIAFSSEYGNRWCTNLVKYRFCSTTTDVCFHPKENGVIAASSVLCKVKILSAYVRKTDRQNNVKKRGVFGKVLSEFVCDSWPNAIAFSPLGETLCVVCHNSTVIFVGVDQSEMTFVLEDKQIVRCPCLPFKACLFLNEDAAVCAGFNYAPVLFIRQRSHGKMLWRMEKSLDQTFSSREFMYSYERGMMNTTKHKNVINDVRLLEANGNSFLISTSGLGGRVFQWRINL